MAGDAPKHLPQLECPACQRPCLPPIYMCRNGHNLCHSCRQEADNCPTCGDNGRPNSRNMYAERVCRDMRGICKYEQLGCSQFVLKKDLAEHNLNCQFRFTCGMCHLYGGDLPGLKQHVSAVHSVFYSVGDDWEGFVPNYHRTFRYLFCHNALFRCEFKASSQGLMLYSRYLGPRRKAAGYRCEFVFVSEADEEEFIYVVRCLPTQHASEDVGALVPSDVRDNLLRDYGSLLCRISIVKGV